jgi:hypothetical protein
MEKSMQGTVYKISFRRDRRFASSDIDNDVDRRHLLGSITLQKIQLSTSHVLYIP